MATAASATTDLTTCSICRDTYDNPKSLPCLHAFCLKCLQHLCVNKSPGDRATCPVCREEFQIPAEGIRGLKHHFLLQQLVCQLQRGYCKEHKKKEVVLYCDNCYKNICEECSVDKHRYHHSYAIREAADNFRLAIDDDDKQIQSVINTVREKLGLVTEFLTNAEDIKRKVLATGDVIKHSVDSQINDVLMELESVTSESATQAQSVRQACQLAIASMESFHTESQELLDKGRPSDITRAACELHDRATELLDSDVTAVKYNPPRVTFSPADVTQVQRLTLIGKLTVTAEEQPGVSCVLYVHIVRLLVLSTCISNI